MNIVSFYAPRRAHRFFQDYTPFLQILGDSCRKFGHRHIIITDDPEIGRMPECLGAAEFGIGEGFRVDLPENLMKAIIAGQLAYLKSALAKEDTVLLGADCVLARDPAEVFRREFDIAFTTGPFSDCILNTGAIYIRGGYPAAFIWERALANMGEEWGDDQLALAAVVGPTLEPSVKTGPGGTIAFLPVDPYNLAPEYPGDDCTRGYVLHFRGPRKDWMRDYCAHWLGIGEKIRIETRVNTDPEKIYANINANSHRDLPWIEEIEAHNRFCMIVGGGPSVRSDLWVIKAQAEAGYAIFALNGAAKWLKSEGVTPDYQVILDARHKNVEFLEGWPAKEALIASQCDPAVFDAAPVGRTALFHAADPRLYEFIPEGRRAFTVGGGITVGLTAMGLAYLMGYRLIHLFGYDSSDQAGETHAYPQEMTDRESIKVDVWVGQRKFTAPLVMARQVDAFKEFAPRLADAGATIFVHGDGLLPAVAHEMSRLAAEAERE